MLADSQNIEADATGLAPEAVDGRNTLVLSRIALSLLPVIVPVGFLASLLHGLHRDVHSTRRDPFVIVWIRRQLRCGGGSGCLRRQLSHE